VRLRSSRAKRSNARLGEPWGDAVALIGDLERQPGSGAAGSQHDLALAVAQGVVDQVAECLTQAQLVVVHDGG
jgi:hypothetical protein